MSSIVKAVISIYRRGEEKPIERYKARISVTEDSTKQGIDNLKKHLADFLGLKEQARKLGLGSFNLKLYPYLRHLTVPLSLLSVTRKFPKSSSALSLNLSKWMNLKVTRTVTTLYDETESEEIVEHRNAITRSGRQIKASVRFDL